MYDVNKEAVTVSMFLCLSIILLGHTVEWRYASMHS